MGGQAQVELHVIHQHQKLRPSGFQVTLHPMEQATQPRVLHQDFPQADDGEFRDVDERVHTRTAHGFATHAGKRDPLSAFPDRVDETGTEMVAGGFPGTDDDVGWS
jgi:hypothetical protein